MRDAICAAMFSFVGFTALLTYMMIFGVLMLVPLLLCLLLRVFSVAAAVDSLGDMLTNWKSALKGELDANDFTTRR